MAYDDDDRNRRKERREEEDAKARELQEALRKSQPQMFRREMASPAEEARSVDIDALLARAEPLIEQVHALYQQYLAGVEKLPPVERRKQLEQMMAVVHLAAKSSPNQRFRAQNLTAKFTTMRDLWDRLMLDLESGKRKR